MANVLEGHKRQALIFLPGLFFMAVAWHSSWGTGSGSFGGRSLPGGQAGHAYTLCKAKAGELPAARSSQDRAAAGTGSICHSPADICSPGLSWAPGGM